MITYNGKKYVCNIDLGMELIRGKWKAVILCHLNDGPKRFLELQRITCGVSQKVLNEKLHELERDGLILKIVYPEVPPKVEFLLTEIGKELFPALEMIQNWSTKNFPNTKKLL
ncbi:helix-turn-helix transcriptional regulator [Clostridium bowmanii]|uniref:winged helix-turn-helix transcriptional regulator n=1 Tax=Clostridium bowmanii TaxID=132925 RepID=UPI001C0B7B07|nr:helix-turn-helix domain-containing protein [Clostridium bowmanii]MBU3191460.1 helix-turn-helix transcriptional regulator [Clostridium bowmanii]MCA1075840.1 helix-turn-helix transcriptional regulator [Clostridium bowmanii]